MSYLTADVIKFSEIKSLFLAAEELTDEISLNVEFNHVSCRLMDRSHIQYMTFRLNMGWFATYNFKERQNVVLDTEELKKVMKVIKDNDKVRIEIEEEVVNFVIKNGGYTKLKVNRMEEEIETPEPPEYNPDYEMTFNLNHIANAVNKLKDSTEKMEFYFDGNNLYLGNDGYEAKLYGRPWQREQCFTKLSTNQLRALVKTVPFSKRVRIEYGYRMPMKFNIKSSREGAEGYFLIAPLLDEEEDGCGDCKGKEEETCSECNGRD